MRLQDRPGALELAQLAAAQHGVVEHAQLRSLGLSAPAIQRRVRSGHLYRLYRGVYAVGHPVLTREGRWVAAVLACGDRAVLSHRDAAALRALRPSARHDIDVTAARTRGRHAGITLHHVRRLHPDDVTEIDRIPVTSTARTLLDLAEVVPLRQLQRAFEQAERLELIDMRAIDALLARSRGRRGLKPLTRVIDAARPLPFTRSDFERDFLDLCQRAGLPEPAMNLWVAGYEVDALWEDPRLIVELDGRTWHRARARTVDGGPRTADRLAGGRVRPSAGRQPPSYFKNPS